MFIMQKGQDNSSLEWKLSLIFVKKIVLSMSPSPLYFILIFKDEFSANKGFSFNLLSIIMKMIFYTEFHFFSRNSLSKHYFNYKFLLNFFFDSKFLVINFEH